MSKGGVLFQDPFPLIYSVHWDFTPNFVICCTTFSLSRFQVVLLQVQPQHLGKTVTRVNSATSVEPARDCQVMALDTSVTLGSHTAGDVTGDGADMAGTGTSTSCPVPAALLSSSHTLPGEG